MRLDTNFKQKLESLRLAFEDVLSDYLDRTLFKPQILNESMRYSLQIGGKRLRPVLMFACAQMLGGKVQDVANLALALEMIHTYSLIHDDLPAMDNDDFRRGKPSNHRQFGEGQAILAGDALLNEAYLICFEECSKGKTYRNAALAICKNAGAYGMIAGQAADLYWQGREGAGAAESEFIILNKTARMLMSAVSVPAYVYDADENIVALFNEFGKNFGFLFQITDDLLDVSGTFEKTGKTVGKDAKEQKLSTVNLYGAEKCRELADHYEGLCHKILDEMPFESVFLQELVSYVRNREG